MKNNINISKKTAIVWVVVTVFITFSLINALLSGKLVSMPPQGTHERGVYGALGVLIILLGIFTLNILIVWFIKLRNKQKKNSR